MVIISNVSSSKRSRKSFKEQALNHLVKTENAGFAGLRLDTYDTIANSGATQIFVMDGTPVVIKRPTTHPLKVALADGRIVVSTHMCDIKIDGLPTVLTGHIIPDLSIASLFGIRVLTEAGCMVTFDKTNCSVRYNGAIILRGAKDPATDLWTLPLGSPKSTPSHHVTDTIPPAAPEFANARANIVTESACFTHTVRQKQTAYNLPTNHSVAQKYQPLSKHFGAGTSKGAPISRRMGSQNISIQVLPQLRDI